jgi:hypothetical protein
VTQQSPNPQAEEAGTSRGKNKRARPYTIESRWNLTPETRAWGEWRVSGRYRSEAERDTALENFQRKHPSGHFQYRKGGES